MVPRPISFGLHASAASDCFPRRPKIIASRGRLALLPRTNLCGLLALGTSDPPLGNNGPTCLSTTIHHPPRNGAPTDLTIFTHIEREDHRGNTATTSTRCLRSPATTGDAIEKNRFPHVSALEVHSIYAVCNRCNIIYIYICFSQKHLRCLGSH